MQDGEGVGKRRANFFIVFLWWQTPDNAVEGQNARTLLSHPPFQRVSKLFRTCIFPHTGERRKKQAF